MPARTRGSSSFETLPVCSVRRPRSMVTIWEAFATESFGRSVRRARSKTLPGSRRPAKVARQGYDHNRRQSAGVQRIALNDDDGAPKPRPRAHQVGERGPEDVALGDYHSLRSRACRPASASQSSGGGVDILQNLVHGASHGPRGRGEAGIRPRPPGTPGCETSPASGPTHRPCGTARRGSTQPSSYQKYDLAHRLSSSYIVAIRTGWWT